jgi:trehalose-6-phosphate synthase
MALFIISNRLPLKVSKTDNEYVYERSEGGLATGLGSLKDFKKRNGLAGREFFRITRRKKKRFGRVYCLRIFILFFFLKIRIVTIMKVTATA